MNHNDRVQHVIARTAHKRKRYILYHMQQAQRVFYNHALKWAITLANQEGLPLLVFFGLDPQFPDGNIRHFTFMIEGLFEV
ncbi:MAG: hypothetical protein WC351_02325, partial [Candidatus Izemoplasmatales bacterium]